MDIFNKKDLSLVSLLLRIALGSLLLAAGLIKIYGGVSGNVAYYMSMFEKSMLPVFLIKGHATIIMFVEFILAVWLLTGFKLRLAWIVSALTFISLAFGMMFAYKFEIVSGNYTYVVFCCIGILLTPYDRFHIGAKLQGSKK